MRVQVGKWILILLAIELSATAIVGTVLAQATDSLPPVPVDPKVQFIIGMGFLAAFLASQIGSMLVAKWNKAGNWLDGKSNGLKRAVAVALSGALGLGISAVAGLLTHATNWMVSFGLSLLGGILTMVTARLNIDAVKSKMSASERSAVSNR